MWALTWWASVMGDRDWRKAYCSGVGVIDGRGSEAENEKGRSSSVKFLRKRQNVRNGAEAG